MCVPDSVPSVTQSSLPFVPSFATKARKMPIGVKYCGLLEGAPGLMSLTGSVVAPFVRQSSRPALAPSSALK